MVLRSVDPAVFKVVLIKAGKCCPKGVHGMACSCNNTTPAWPPGSPANLLERAGLVRYPRLESEANHINHVYVRRDVAQACNAAEIRMMS